MSDKNSSNDDQYALTLIFPDAKRIFRTNHKQISDYKDDCIVILDTNTLLVPYTTGKDSIEQISKTYLELANNNRLLLPAQVAREFAKNRPEKIKELFSKFKRKIDGIQYYRGGKYPLLESLESYQNVLDIEKKIDMMLDEYKTALRNTLDHIKNWNWDDPVSQIYGTLFYGDLIYELSRGYGDILKEMSFRYKNRVPPGYKDSSKLDEGIGDFIIWKTILEVGKNGDTNVLFVSGDSKSDWWYISEGQKLYPRYELIDEYFGYTNGKEFNIITLSYLLEMFGVDKEVIAEVRSKESEINDRESPADSYSVIDSDYIMKYVIDKGSSFFEVNRRLTEPYYEAIDWHNRKIGFDVKYITKSFSKNEMIHQITKGLNYVNNHTISAYALIIVFSNFDMALAVKSSFEFYERFPIAIGYISDDGELEIIYNNTELFN